MISITNLSKNYGKKVLFRDISFSINDGEKVGLIGPNGTGKTTLFSLIRGECEPSAGEVQVNRNIRLGYLPQESSFASARTVLAEIIEGDADIMRLQKEKSELEEKNAAGSMHYGEVLHELETLGYFELEHKAKKILSGLGFKEKDFDRPISHLSGGWQMRTLLAKLLTVHYDILLLDEPTNYLDLNAALWLKDYLGGFRGTFVMISHDRAFLDEVTNYTLILENGSIFKVKGNFEHYEAIKEERRGFLIKQAKEQEKKREQLEEFVARFHAQPNKASQVRAKKTALEKMEDIVIPPDPKESIKDFIFPQTRKSGYKVMALENVSKTYPPDVKVYSGLNFEIVQGEKAVLAGDNGAGKSTLLKMMAGVTPIDSGNRVIGYNVDSGYFSQTRLDVLSPENTVLQEAYSAAPGFMSETVLRTMLGAFLFTGDDSEKKVKVLSGGEKSRLILVKLLINPPNFLLLDEPTTHLDVDAVEALIKAIQQYEGTVVFISHDIHFVRSVANVVFEVKDGRVRKFPGKFDYYLEVKDRPEYGGTGQQQKKTPEQKQLDKAQEAKQKAAEEARRLKDDEKQRKAHNIKLRERINRLLKKKDELQVESYAKVRALSEPNIYRRDEEMAKEYGRRLKEIEQELIEIDLKINSLETEIQ